MLGTTRGPSTSLRISPAGSDACFTAQVRILAAQPSFTRGSSDVGYDAGSFDFAQDFASRLGRLLYGSSSNPSGPAKFLWCFEKGVQLDCTQTSCKRVISHGDNSDSNR